MAKASQAGRRSLPLDVSAHRAYKAGMWSSAIIRISRPAL